MAKVDVERVEYETAEEAAAQTEKAKREKEVEEYLEEEVEQVKYAPPKKPAWKKATEAAGKVAGAAGGYLEQKVKEATIKRAERKRPSYAYGADVVEQGIRAKGTGKGLRMGTGLVVPTQPQVGLGYGPRLPDIHPRLTKNQPPRAFLQMMDKIWGQPGQKRAHAIGGPPRALLEMVSRLQPKRKGLFLKKKRGKSKLW